MKGELGSKLKKVFANAKIGFKKHSPEILIAGGITGIIVSTVLACVATTKVKGVVADSKKDILAIHNKENENSETYSKKEVSRDLTKVYFKTGAKVLGLYAPSVVLGALSITSIVASNHILKKRAMALAAAYATVDKSFKDYRSRVVERFGSDVDKELRYGVHTEKVSETTTDPVTGEEKKVKKNVKKVTYDGISDYARIFDGKNPNYRNENDFNLYFLRQMQSYFNDKLQVEHHVYLNDVYRELGFPETKAGQVVGWIYDKYNNTRGDNYIDFGITEICTSEDADDDFVEYGYLLDFNIDGDILTYAHEE